MLSNQIHIRNEIENLDFSKVIYKFVQPDTLGDRIGGFWTSTYDDTFGCEYIHYKIFKPYAHIYKGYVFEVKQDVQIFIVNSQEDEDVFEEKYNSDFNLLAKDFDCIHITSDYIRYIRCKRIDSNFLHWTCDCTWWFNIEMLQLIEVLDGTEIKKFAKVKFNK